jgi:hypothetical protein
MFNRRSPKQIRARDYDLPDNDSQPFAILFVRLDIKQDEAFRGHGVGRDVAVRHRKSGKETRVDPGPTSSLLKESHNPEFLLKLHARTARLAALC